MSSNQIELDPPPGDVISTIQFAPGTSTKLLVASWDKHVYLYDIQAGAGAQLLQTLEHRAPVLDACFGADETVAYSVGLDWDVRKINLENGTQQVLSSHEAPASKIVYDPNTKLVISSSWDKTLHIHNTAAPDSEPATLPLPHKPLAISISSTKLVVAMAGRNVSIFDLQGLALLTSQAAQPPPNIVEAQPFQRRESSLKFMTRAVACMPNDAGFACSSIEGRVAVEWFDASAESQTRKYAFKCHRQASKQEPGVDIVYPVHCLEFHPVHGTFASGGGDGVVALWDAVAKRRIRQYNTYPSSVAAMSFSGDGKWLAVAVSPSFENAGEDDQDQGRMGEGPVKIFVRELAPGEAQAKAKGAK